jgi:hypothetical protein
LEPVALILAALATGTPRGVGSTAGTAEQEAYAALCAALNVRLATQGPARRAMGRYVTAPGDWREVAWGYLRQAAVARDKDIVDMAIKVLKLADSSGVNAGKYAVIVNATQGAQVGDHNYQINNNYTPGYSYAEFTLQLKGSAPTRRYQVFWSDENRDNRVLLLGDPAHYEIAVALVREPKPADEDHVLRCLDLIQDVDAAVAAHVLTDLDDKLRNRISAGIAPGLSTGVPDQWCEELLERLRPEHAAYLIDTAMSLGGAVGRILNATSAERTAAIVLEDRAKAFWLNSLDGDRLHHALVVAAQTKPARLAALLTEMSAAKASKLLRDMAHGQSVPPRDFFAVTNHLAKWHRVVFMAAADLPDEYLKPVLPHLRDTVGAWRWMAPAAAVFGIWPVRHDGSWTGAVVFVMRQVWTATGRWVPGLQAQRDRVGMKIAAAAMVLLSILFVYVLLV